MYDTVAILGIRELTVVINEASAAARAATAHAPSILPLSEVGVHMPNPKGPVKPRICTCDSKGVLHHDCVVYVRTTKALAPFG